MSMTHTNCDISLGILMAITKALIESYDIEPRRRLSGRIDRAAAFVSTNAKYSWIKNRLSRWKKKIIKTLRHKQGLAAARLEEGRT
jgi:hypothetical protein